MTSNRSLKVRLTYHLQNKGSFELLEFAIEQVEKEPTFEVVFLLLKEMKCFNSSIVYLSTRDQREQIFGNYNLQKIDAGDYKEISLNTLIEKLSFPFTEIQNKEGEYSGIGSDREYNERIREITRMHLSINANCFELNIADEQRDKFGVSSVWEEFKNFICIDSENNRVQIITTGMD